MRLEKAKTSSTRSFSNAYEFSMEGQLYYGILKKQKSKSWKVEKPKSWKVEKSKSWS